MVRPVPQAVFQPADTHREGCAGPSLLDLMWASLVDELASLMPGGEYHEDAEPGWSLGQQGDGASTTGWTEERARIQGACQGIAACIALVLNPYFPNVDDVKAEAVTRWIAQEASK